MSVWREGWYCTSETQAWETYRAWCELAGIAPDVNAQTKYGRIGDLAVYSIREPSR